MRNPKIFLFISFVALSACQSTSPGRERGTEPIETKAVMPVAKQRSLSGNGGLLMVTEFHGEGQSFKGGKCRWRMVEKTSGRSVFVNLAGGTTATYTSLPPGTYLTGRLGCGINKIWDLDKIFADGITVEAGRVSYIGRLTFAFLDSQLKEVKKGSRAESAAAFAGALSVIPTGSNTDEIVSAFTGRVITPAMTSAIKSAMTKAGAPEGFDIEATGLKNAAAALEPMARSLKACANAESASDPLRVGLIDDTILYKQGRFSEVKSRAGENAFSDRFKSCIEQSFMKFQSADRGDFEVRIRY